MSSYPSGYTATTFKSAVFDNDAVRNTSLGTVDLLSFGSFDCRYYASDGNARRPAGVDHRAVPARLTISGPSSSTGT